MKGVQNLLIVLFWVIVAVAVLVVLATWFGFTFPVHVEQLESMMLDLQGKEQLSLDAGHKALHIKILPGATPEVWEFHLTDQLMHMSDKTSDIGYDVKQYFKIKVWDNKYCTLYLTKKTPPPLLGFVQGLDKNYIAYVYPGSTIQDGLTDIDSGVVYFYGCNAKFCNELPEKYTICIDGCGLLPGCQSHFGFSCDKSAADAVLGQDFADASDRCNEFTEGCPYNKKGEAECCKLLQTDLAGGGHNYKIKNGLICGYAGGNAMWYTCTDINNGKVVYRDAGGGVQFRCKYSPATEIGKWEVTSGEGLYIDNVKIKYQGTVDLDTSLYFDLINYKENLNDVDITTKIIDSPFDFALNCFNDYSEYTHNCGDMNLLSICSFNTNNYGFLGYDHFCFKAKTFEVAVTSGSFEQKFTIKCSPTDSNGSPIDPTDLNNRNKWYSCDVYRGGYINLGGTITKTCDSTEYTVRLSSITSYQEIGVTLTPSGGSGEIKENSVKVFDGKLEVAVGDVDFDNNKAMIDVQCV